jgi:hypothetical protein
MQPPTPSGANLAAQHFANFLYRRVARHWHSLWVRWHPDGSVKQRFHAERIFAPAADGSDGVQMRVVYHYGDERGTVSEGPTSGPWTITEAEHSRPDGLAHPSSPDSMATLMLPGGPSAWCMKQSPAGAPCAVEMFLHHADEFRASFGVIHAPDGALQQLSLIREDTRGPWPKDDWSGSDAASRVSAAELHEALVAAGAPVDADGTGSAITADLRQSAIEAARWPEFRAAQIDADADVALLCDRFVVVGPAMRTAGVAWSAAAAWWPEARAGETKRLYTIEVRWDAQGGLEGVRTAQFEAGARP